MEIKRVLEIIIWVVQGFSNSELEKLKHNSAYKSNYDQRIDEPDLEEIFMHYYAKED